MKRTMRWLGSAVRRVFLLLSMFVLPVSVHATIPPESFEVVSIEKLLGQNSMDERVWTNREATLEGINSSLHYLASAEAEEAYRRFRSGGLTRERVIQSLVRFRALLLSCHSWDELRTHLSHEFLAVRLSSSSSPEAVRFTGYFQPTYKASRVRTARFRYPVYRLPPNFASWKRPHPTRMMLEGYDGSGSAGAMLRGYEIAYLEKRYEVYMVHVQGSAILEFPDGSRAAVGFAAGTDYPFTGIGGLLVKEKGVSGGKVEEYFNANPDVLNRYMARNNRFIFFKENASTSPIGCLGVPVIPERSIATDKSRMPPGALAVISAVMPQDAPASSGGYRQQKVSRIVFDHDTGKAIKGPARADIFMGTGREAQKKANSVSSNGDLFYLLLK